MKICLISNLYPPIVQGGAEIYVGRLARALAQRHQVVVVTSEPGLRLTPRRESTSEGITIYRLAPLNVAHLTTLPHHLLPQAVFRGLDFYHPQIRAWVQSIVAAEGPDVVHLHNTVGLSLGAVVTAVRGKLPLAITLHDYSLLCAYASIRHPDGHTCQPDLPCRLVLSLNHRLTRAIRLAISPSAYVLHHHLQRGFFERAEPMVLPYGIEPQPDRIERIAPAGKATFDILFLGRVQFHKGPEVLIRAFRRLSDPSLRLHVAGIGPSLGSSQRLAAGDDRIHFHGFVSGERRRALLESVDCIVLPSLWPDNYPVSIQEAFQAGIPAIASRTGGVPEMVRDGVNGLLVAPGDEGGLADAIERLRQGRDLMAVLQRGARETARLYDMDYHVRHLEAAYSRLQRANRVGDFERPAA